MELKPSSRICDVVLEYVMFMILESSLDANAVFWVICFSPWNFLGHKFAIKYISTLIPVIIGRSLCNCINAKLYHVLYIAERYRMGQFN